MAGFWGALLGAVFGAVVGAASTLVADRWLQRREEAERLTATRREVYGEYLDAAHALFLALQEEVGAEPSPHRGQIALERLRLVAPLPTEAAATALWNRLRRDRARRHPDETWVAAYWKAEKQFLTLARADMGLPPLRGGDGQ